MGFRFKQENLGHIWQGLDSRVNKARLLVNWNKFKDTSKYAILRALTKTYIGEFLVAFMINFIVVLFEVSIPIFLNKLIQFMQAPKGEDGGIWVGIGYVFGWIIVNMFAKILLIQAEFKQAILADKSYNGLVGLLYSKLLRVSSATNKQFSQGELINFIQVDSEKLCEIAFSFPPVARLPIQLIFSIIFLYYYVGYFVFVIFIMGGITIVVNYFFAKINAGIQKKALERKDRRMNATTEIVNNIKIIKLNSWNDYFINKVFSLRSLELFQVRKGYIINSLEIIISWVITPYILLFTFSLFFLTDHDLSLANAFACMHVMYSLESPIKWIPNFIGYLMEFVVSMNRIQKFLL